MLASREILRSRSQVSNNSPRVEIALIIIIGMKGRAFVCIVRLSLIVSGLSRIHVESSPVNLDVL